MSRSKGSPALSGPAAQFIEHGGIVAEEGWLVFRGPMRIAFDLDGTIIPGPGSPMAIESLGWLARLISHEQIRQGAPSLFRELRRQGHEVWIYTTSLRNPARQRLWFAAFGVRLDGIVNHTRHVGAMAEKPIICSKYPPAFGIELLIDDAEGVSIEGDRLGFPVLRVFEHDDSWCDHIRRAVNLSRNLKSPPDRRNCATGR